jgi:IMP dehydrogenase
MKDRIVGEGITYDDVVLVPGYSDVLPAQVDVRSRLTRNIVLNIPLVSAPMDTVTESELAIALAQEGGMGIIHKNMSVEAQCREVDKVKRSENGIIFDPVTLPPEETVGSARRIMEDHKISGIPIVTGRRLVGILTRRDLKFQNGNDRRIADVMTRENLVVAKPDTTLDQAKDLLNESKVEKLLLVDNDFNLAGLITIRDIDKLAQYPNACKDARGRLRVGAAVGVMDFNRVEKLLEVNVDVVTVDTAHGHTKNVIETVRQIRKHWDIDVIAGNIATAEAARALIDAGADGVKVGIGPGSICTTRVVAGVGVPQLTAVVNAVSTAKAAGIPVIADGGIRHSGDVTKAIAAGASSVMMGSLFAGLAESPGEVVFYKGRQFKTYRGMGSLGAMVTGSADRYGQGETRAKSKLVPEGVEGRVPYRGMLAEFTYQMVGGLRAGMGYVGAKNIAELQDKARFYRVSGAGLTEAHPHDIQITRESPNYTPEHAVETD